LLLGELR